MRQNRVLLFLGAVITIGGSLTLLLSNTILYNWLIVGFGIRVFGHIKTIGICIVAGGMLIMLLACIPLLRTWLQARHTQSQQSEQERKRERIVAAYAEDNGNPRLARQRLELFQTDFPSFGEITNCNLDYLAMLDVLRTKQELLIKSNDAKYINDTIEVFNGVERSICQNIQSIINLCTVAQNPQALETAKVDEYLDNSRKMLDDTVELLKLSGDYVNQYNRGKNETCEDLLKARLTVMSRALEERGVIK